MSTIFIIRHAEKPDDSNGGVDQAGASDDKSLIVRGWQRAGALAVFFGSSQGLPAPDRIYGSDPTKEKVDHEKLGSDSKRPLETITPLAAKLGLDPIVKFAKGQEADLAAEIATLKGITLVGWQHEAIPAIANALLGTTKGIPQKWPGDRFDVVWRFERADASKPWAFDQVCQGVLQGDGSKPIPV